MVSTNTCDACYGSKKKCDASSPSCTRCARLKITCTGRDRTRYIFKEHFASPPSREKLQHRSGARTRRQTPVSPDPCFEIITAPPPPTRRSPDHCATSRREEQENCSKTLSRRFSAALNIGDPKFDLSSLADWLAQVPERLGADSLLDKTAAAFLDAFDRLQSEREVTGPSPAYNVALLLLDSTLQDESRPKSVYLLITLFMLHMVQKWTMNSAEHYISHLTCICQVLNDTVKEGWGEPLAQSVRLSLIRIVCVESIINSSLALDRRNLQSLKCDSGPYMPLDEENGQAIESLELPFLLRISYILRSPGKNYDELSQAYARLKTEGPFTRRRYQSLAGISRMAGMNRFGLVQAETRLGIAHTTILGILLVLNACLSAMEPMNTDLRKEAVTIGQEAIQMSHKMLQGPPQCEGFCPIALMASWIATDDPDITYNVFSTAKEHNSYWADPAYMDQAKTLKKQLLQLPVQNSMGESSDHFQNYGLAVSYSTHGSHYGGRNQDAFPSLSHEPRNQVFDIDSRVSSFSGQLSPLSDIHSWSSAM
ncbi:hypothetical protein NLG97_g6613 [Lecanicillium saksenae]|uniref:Uncharacterized protein n=1 Tax=Lecanicillium saksenae TaxID=468837 RepID=A0ACC1QPP9_9HYPO|nr:hypothetical protein NLG97_g6613 [Lecanicillium saksenae]